MMMTKMIRGGSVAMMQARADDHADGVTTNTNDDLFMNIEVTYLKNVELQWSDLIITLDDDGDGDQSNYLFKSRSSINIRLQDN